MDILVLGGTIFLGRHLVTEALERGHRVTMLNRGRHGPDLFPDAERLTADRDGDLSFLEGRRWDAVIDTCGYVPRVVRASAEALAGRVGHYTFVSSISVYAETFGARQHEDDAVGVLADPTVEEVTGETYGPLKALCEQAAEQALPGRTLTVRPGLIIGPWDPSGRFTYWPVRLRAGGRVLAPGDPDAPVQVIDGRDLAAWMLDAVERDIVGVFNATGPRQPLTMRQVLESCRSAAGSAAELVWVGDDDLLARDVGPWMELPLWVPSSMGSMTADIERAVSAGLSFRPLAETARDTLAWVDEVGESVACPAGSGAGLARAKEAEILASF